MNKTIRSFVLSVMLVITPLVRVARGQQLAEDNGYAARVKFDIAKRIREFRSNVSIRVRNGKELKGRITGTSENMFSLREDKTRHTHDINYADVSKIKGQGLSKGAKFGILTAFITGAVIIGALVSMKNVDPFEHGVLH